MRVKEKLQDIARDLVVASYGAATHAQSHELVSLAKRVREAGTLIEPIEIRPDVQDRVEDAKRIALEAYDEFTRLVNDGVFNEA